MQPLRRSASAFLHDQEHFLTPIEETIPNELVGRLRLEPVEDVSRRYQSEPGFTPESLGFTLWHVGGDVLDAVRTVRLAGVDARPLYGFGFCGHWSLEPGGEPPEEIELGDGLFAADLNQELNLERNDEGSGIVVGVIDAGFENAIDLREMARNGGFDDAPDPYAKAADLIHGTYVSSIIKLVAPRAVVRERNVPMIDTELVQMNGLPLESPRRCTDDLAVGAAIDQIGPGCAYLNLSLGTYLAEIDGTVLAPSCVESALHKVLEEGVEVVAAGGNDILVRNIWRGTAAFEFEPVFYPAAHPEVLAVGTADHDGRPRKWFHGTSGVAFDDWWDVTAPGVDLVGAPFFRMGMLDYGARWSGSSFASAVVTGALAAGSLAKAPAELRAMQVTETSDPILDYHTVHGLIWRNAEGVVIRP